MRKGTLSDFPRCVMLFVITLLFLIPLPIGENPVKVQGKLMAAEAPEGQSAAEQFNQTCSACHPEGGNVFKPHLPLKKAPQLEDFDAFLSYLRSPKARDGSDSIMPPFSFESCPDEQARAIYQEILRLREKE